MRGRGDFARVMDEGQVRPFPFVVLRFCPNGLQSPRVAFTASRRVGNAVHRNRAKRLLREAVRQLPLSGGWDLVFIARPAMARAEWSAISAAVRELVQHCPAGRPESPANREEKGEEAS